MVLSRLGDLDENEHGTVQRSMSLAAVIGITCEWSALCATFDNKVHMERAAQMLAWNSQIYWSKK